MDDEKNVTVDALSDRVVRLLDREIARLEDRKRLSPDEIYMLTRVLEAAAKVQLILIDPLGGRGRKAISKMSTEELRDLQTRLRTKAQREAAGE